MSMFDNLKAKAEELISSNPDKVEEYSDQALDTASDKASDLTGGKFDEQIQQGRDAADGAIGE